MPPSVLRTAAQGDWLAVAARARLVLTRRLAELPPATPRATRYATGCCESTGLGNRPWMNRRPPLPQATARHGATRRVYVGCFRDVEPEGATWLMRFATV